MSECERCGVSGERATLHNAISNNGVVKLCDNCVAMEKLPMIKKATEKQIEKSLLRPSVKERLSGMSNRGAAAKKEVSLRELVDKHTKKTQNPSDLIDNFHWEINRLKRIKKVSREELAKAIGESDATIRMLEQGILPNNNYQAIAKIENFFGVSLRKQGFSGFPDTSQKAETEVPKEAPKEQKKSFWDRLWGKNKDSKEEEDDDKNSEKVWDDEDVEEGFDEEEK